MFKVLFLVCKDSSSWNVEVKRKVYPNFKISMTCTLLHLMK